MEDNCWYALNSNQSNTIKFVLGLKHYENNSTANDDLWCSLMLFKFTKQRNITCVEFTEDTRYLKSIWIMQDSYVPTWHGSFLKVIFGHHVWSRHWNVCDASLRCSRRELCGCHLENFVGNEIQSREFCGVLGGQIAIRNTRNCVNWQILF